MDDIFSADLTFDDLGLSGDVLRGVKDAGFEHPTDIQAKLIPVALAGRDALGQAKTGTGKTAAFGLPILTQADPGTKMQALILAPTRELANQIVVEINELGRRTPIRAVSIVGGEAYQDQLNGIKEGGHIIVGTPGRIMDMRQRRQIHFNDLRWVVLDEVDRMLDIGFRDDIRQILSKISGQPQTMFVSATIGPEIERLSRRFMRDDVEKIATVAGSLTVSQVTQKYLSVKPWDKRRLLRHLLTHEEADLTLVFCRTKETVRNVTRFLKDRKIDAHEIHGDLTQGRRNRVMNTLRRGKLDVLIASDLASRGLDVQDISHIINYDLPDDPEVYVHRIGRTARAGRKGTAWSFVTPDQGQLLTEIEKLTSVHIEELDYPDFKPGTPPPGAEQPAAPVREPRSRLTEAVSDVDEADASQFPGGVVPKSAPRRTLGSRFKTRRSR